MFYPVCTLIKCGFLALAQARREKQTCLHPSMHITVPTPCGRLAASQSKDAVCVCACVLQQRAETRGKRPLTVIIAGKSQISDCKALSLDRWSGQLAGGLTEVSAERCNMPLILRPAGTGSRCWQKRSNTKWIHEVRIALLRRRAALTRAVSPNTKARRGHEENTTSDPRRPLIIAHKTSLCEDQKANGSRAVRPGRQVREPPQRMAYLVSRQRGALFLHALVVQSQNAPGSGLGRTTHAA